MPASSLRDHDGQQLAYVYFENEPGAAISGEVVDEGGVGCGLVLACASFSLTQIQARSRLRNM
jgi:hypothetical protein